MGMGRKEEIRENHNGLREMDIQIRLLHP